MVDNFMVNTAVLPVALFLLLVVAPMFVWLKYFKPRTVTVTSRIIAGPPPDGGAFPSPTDDDVQTRERKARASFGVSLVLSFYFFLLLWSFAHDVWFAESFDAYVINSKINNEMRNAVREHPAYLPCIVVGLAPIVFFSVVAWWLRAHDRGDVSFLTRSWVGVFLGELVAFFIGAVIALLMLSNWSLLCNYKASEFRQLCDFAAELRDDVEELTGKRTMWVHNGGLLAIYRPVDRANNCFISNDHDFDLCIERKHFAKALAFFRGNRKYHFAYWNVFPDFDQDGIGQHPQKIRVYPRWARMHQGHSGVWCVDVDECHYRKAPLEELTGCNGHKWGVTSLNDSIAYFEKEYAGTQWDKPTPLNHWGMCYFLKYFGLKNF